MASAGRRLFVRTASVTALAASLVLAGCSGDDEGTNSPGTSGDRGDVAARGIEVVNREAWPMHPIDGRFRGANGLGPADVDGDGAIDYVTNYEFDQRWILALNPRADGDVRGGWPTVEIWAPDPLVSGNGKNPESAALGDFDGDGNIDAAGAHGFSDFAAWEGSAPGVHLVWGPERDRVEDPHAWVDGGWVPATLDVGHPLWVAAHDVNGDGLLDVTVGGRMHGGGGGYASADSPNGNGTFTGIGWLEAPADPARRRDLAEWRFHRIDPDQYSGHGFVFADLDGDGDDDIVDANADFDTPEDEEEVVWYENPGNGTEAQREPWMKTTLLRSPDFFAKPSVAVGDLDGDGRPDIVTQTASTVILFRQTSSDPVTFETVELPKPPEIAGTGRPVRVADFDGDGDLDIAGALIHEGGDLPAARAAVFVMLNDGDPWSIDGWTVLPVKWGSGRTMQLPDFGEKWDQLHVVDVDGDGDLDIVANCEEWWVQDGAEVVPFFDPAVNPSSVAVVWFENRLGEEPDTYEERDGRVVLDATRVTRIGDSTWVERAPVRDDPTGARAMQALNALDTPEGGIAFEETSGLQYRFEVSGGDYTIWARVRVPASWGYGLGGDRSDAAWIGVGDAPAMVIGDAPGGETETWTWERVGAPAALAAGDHDLFLRVREHGIAIDRIVLTEDATDEPHGEGPEPTVRGR
jgi:hypothetical protein